MVICIIAIYLVVPSLVIVLLIKIKLLCVRVRKSARAMEQAPGPVVVGMRYSSGVASLISWLMYSSSTRKRPEQSKREGVLYKQIQR